MLFLENLPKISRPCSVGPPCSVAHRTQTYLSSSVFCGPPCSVALRVLWHTEHKPTSHRPCSVALRVLWLTEQHLPLIVSVLWPSVFCGSQNTHLPLVVRVLWPSVFCCSQNTHTYKSRQCSVAFRVLWRTEHKPTSHRPCSVAHRTHTVQINIPY